MPERGTWLLSRRWAPEILLALGEESRRFNQLMRVTQLADRQVTIRLRELIDDGLVERDVDPGPPIKVTYRLTQVGHRYIPALRALQEVASQAS